MTAYIIAYSVIMFCLVAASIAACLLIVHAERRKSQKTAAARAVTSEGERAFSAVYSNGFALAFVLLEEATGQPVFISPSVQTFFGVSAEELFCDTQAFGKHIGKNYTREFLRGFENWDRSGAFRTEFAYGENSFAVAEAKCAEADGKKYIAFVISDITAQHNKELEMQGALDDALDQAAAKSSYLSNMSHEIRTPMNGVMGMMKLARMNIDDKEKTLSYLTRAGELSVFLLSMINDILDISKIESGKMQLFNTQTDLYAFADKIRNMFQGTITGKGIEFLVETVDITARYLIVDEMRLTQVVTNFVSNASKFTPAGGKISVTFKELGRMGGKIQLMIRVRDSGKGIAPENIRKIFRPFEQEEASTSHRYGGTGLGLAICDNIVRLMGGNIVVDSTLGKGTDFSVFLSLEVADAAQERQTPVSGGARNVQKQAEKFTFEKCRILLAEDNEINAEIAIEILESEGAKVTLAHDGQEAVDIFTEKKEGSFDLLLLDIQMPRLNGRDAARAIRQSGKKDAMSVPIVALSADAFVEDVKLSEAAGMDGHVSKPIDFNELRKRAGEIIAAKKEQR